MWFKNDRTQQSRLIKIKQIDTNLLCKIKLWLYWLHLIVHCLYDQFTRIVFFCLLLVEFVGLDSCKFIMDFCFNLANDCKKHNKINSVHIWKTNQVQVKCKKILACGGGGGDDVFHVKWLLGEGVIYFFQTKRETKFEKEINI